jgi:citrate synthase
VPAPEWLTSEQASRRLGVKPETLYAYVSRGLIGSEREPGQRRSRYLRADVERLAGRQRSGGRAGGLEIIVETELTLLDPTGRLFYRGWDAADAANEATFETVARWLWTGERTAPTFTAPPAVARAAQRVASGFGDVGAEDRIRGVLAAVRGSDPMRHDRRPTAVAETGQTIIATIVDAIPPAQEPVTEGPIAARLWTRLSPRRPTKADVRTLDAALVLLADHELAASTFAARIAASTWADPYLVVLAGLATLGGPLHGGASEQSRALLRDVVGGRPAPEAIGALLADGQLIPGFGHRVYVSRDPRADVLLDRLPARGPVARAGAELRATMAERGLPFPNIDSSLAQLAESYDMVDGAGQLIFAVSRVAGWLAHAIEEYEHRLRFRPRAAYVGPAPTS